MDAKTADARTHEFDVQDVEYLRHGDKPLLARVYKPRGEGPFPALVDLHGGAWCIARPHHRQGAPRDGWPATASSSSRSTCAPAKRGRLSEGAGRTSITRCAGPSCNAKELKTRPDLVGISGQSSGGHLAMLVAMRPHDPRYTAIPLPAGSPAHDATVKCVVMSWPVINPLGRYRFAKRKARCQSAGEWPPDIIARHHQFWGGEANMAEGNPMLMLERGEKVALPPAIWHQGRGDMMHDYKDEDFKGADTEAPRFVANYRKAGGDIELHYFDSDRQPGHSPDLTKIGDTFEQMLAFIGKHLKR